MLPRDGMEHDAPSPSEIELKLRVAPGHAGALPHIHPIAKAPCRRRRLVTRYFDTPDFLLAKQGMVVSPADVQAKNAVVATSFSLLDPAQLK